MKIHLHQKLTALVFCSLLYGTISAQCLASYDTIAQNICSGDSSYFGGSYYLQTGSFNDTLTNTGGCDSIVTLNLSVQPAFYDTMNVGICTGQTFVFNGVGYNATGSFTATFTAVGGCDSLVTLNLQVQQVFYDTIEQSVCSGQTVMFNGVQYGITGLYTVTYTAVGGCDSLVTLDLYVQSISFDTLNETICAGDSFVFNGAAYSAPGSFTDTLKSVAGCDSSVTTLSLVVNPVKYDSISYTICAGDSFNFNGVFYSNAGIYMDTLQAGTTCDSIVTLNLLNNPIFYDTIARVVCGGDSINFNGKWYSVAGTTPLRCRQATVAIASKP